ncbi:alpha/beta fold hydrolase [Solirubrobacter deserti]|uniref:Alpha/beta hydrolase n=1 Tax=Solirubrobacter deserti TaxID=2282478 RepID=A0ABT4RJH1_9ACTN|nr:alpha/beta hydrolase [Solirubrobacter deserti]MDA0138662.1 alpha/beta hydrolase [Solirubrobacter deserti]
MKPLVLIHGFTGSPRVWDLVRPRLERDFEVLTPALPGHLGGPPLPEEITPHTMADAVARCMDEAGWETAYIVGNSLGGALALRLAARGRARAVIGLAPGGGWLDDRVRDATLEWFAGMHELVRGAAPRAAWIASSPERRRQVLSSMSERHEHVPAELVADVIRAAALCVETPRMIEVARRSDWALGPITCPIRMVWGTEDKLLPWPAAAERYRRDLPHAEWIELDGVGHCPQVDVPLETAELISGFA